MKMIKKLAKLNNQKGAELIEVVFTLPLVLFVTFFAIVFILLVYSKLVIADTAVQAARAAALTTGSADSAAQDAAKKAVRNMGLKESNLESTSVSYEPSGASGAEVQYVTVEVIYKQPSLVPYLPKLIGGSEWESHFKVRSKATIKNERLK